MCLDQDLVEPRCLICWFSFEEVSLSGSRSFLVLDDGVDLSDCEEDTLEELVLCVYFEPSVDVLDCRFLDVF